MSLALLKAELESATKQLKGSQQDGVKKVADRMKVTNVNFVNGFHILSDK